MEYEYLSWGANLLNVLLFIYLFLKYYQSPCFNLFETFLSLGTIWVSVSVQLLSVTLKKVQNYNKNNRNKN